MGPDLQVRSVSSTFEGREGSTDLRRGDRIDAVAGQSVDKLADVRAILRGITFGSQSERSGGSADGSTTKRRANESSGAAEVARQSDTHTIDLQVRRPLHHFTIALQREEAKGGGLPPGYNPATDRLLEIDGYRLPDPLGPEQLESIIATRSEALLTFGRKGAIFEVALPVRSSGYPWVPGVIFLCSLIAAAVLWRRHAQEHEPAVAAAIGLESVAFGWIVLLAFAYQWILSDPTLATVIIVSMCMARPLAVYARSRGPTRESNEGLWALAIGGGFAVLLAALVNMGSATRIEIGLFAAASVGALAVVYEMSVLGFEEEATNTLAEGGGYLVAVLVAGFICAFLAWLFDPMLFEEQLWRWFAVGMVGLVWFGDLMFTLRGPLSSTYGNVVSVDQRRDQIASYLEAVGDELPETETRLLVRREGRTVAITLEDGGLQFGEPDDHLRDAVDILIQEDSRIPLPPSEDRSNHPLTGIALSMNIVLALQLHPPEFGLILPDTDIVLVALEEESTGDVPSYASTDAIDFAQARIDAPTWVALFVEGVRGASDVYGGRPEESAVMSSVESAELTPAVDDADAAETTEEASDGGDDGRDEAAEPDASESDDEMAVEDEDTVDSDIDRDEVDERIDRLEGDIERLESELDRERESNETLRDDRRDLASRLQDYQRRWREQQPPVDKRDLLLEDDLLESMTYLVEDDEPIVVGGPYAGGKRYVAHCLAEMDDMPAEAVVHYDAVRDAPDNHHAYLFEASEASNDESDPMDHDFVSVAEKGVFVISSAGLLSDSVLLGLCNRVEALDTRLILCFHDAAAHERSVLEGRPNNVVNRLGHRELVIPPVKRRLTILPAVCEHYIEAYASRLDREVPELSEEAVDWLEQLSYPAQMREVQLWMHRIVLENDGGVVEVEDLPDPIRSPGA